MGLVMSEKKKPDNLRDDYLRDLRLGLTTKAKRPIQISNSADGQEL